MRQYGDLDDFRFWKRIRQCYNVTIFFFSTIFGQMDLMCVCASEGGPPTSPPYRATPGALEGARRASEPAASGLSGAGGPGGPLDDLKKSPTSLVSFYGGWIG